MNSGMRNLKLNAIKVQQFGEMNNGNKAIYIVKIKVRDLIDDSEFQIDYWDQEKGDSADQGYQRRPFPAHVREIGRFALEDEAIFPGAVLVSCRGDAGEVTFDEVNSGIGELTLKHPPFWIIDGQHRIKGLKHCIEEEGGAHWLDRELPVVILANFTKLEEMAQFKILNSTPKKVATDLAQQLMFFRAKKDGTYRGKVKAMGEEWKLRAMRVIEMLNAEEDSPWKGRIKFPNGINNGKQITGQNSMLVSLKPLYTGGYFESTRRPEDEYAILRNYWSALEAIFPESFSHPEVSVILKTSGVFPLHSLLKAIMLRRGGAKENVTQESFHELLKMVFSDVDDYFWSTENDAGASLYGSMKGFRILADDFIDKLDAALE